MHIKHLIIVIILFLAVSFIYSSSSTFKLFGETKTSGIDCIPEQKTNIVNCCYKEYDSETGETTAIYCAQCYDDGTGNLACNAYDKVESIKPPDDSGIPPKGKGGLLGLLDNPTIQPDESTSSPKDKGLLGLLDETIAPTIQQQPLPEITTPQRNIPNTDLFSNLDDNNLLTSVPPKEDSSEPLTLLEEGQKEEQQESSIIEDEDKEEEAEKGEQEEQLSLTQKDDEKQSGENEQEENEQELLKQTSKKQKKVIEGLKDIEDTQSQSQFEIQKPTADLK